MTHHPAAHVGALIGEPSRTAMLLALMDGRAFTATELARAAHVQAPAASRHLAMLVEGGLLRVEQQGRHATTGWRRHRWRRCWKA